MSVSKPQNREEFKSYIKIKLGAPILEINVSDEQLDIAIDDAFQYFNERNHFNGVERMYLTINTNDYNVRNNFSSLCQYDMENVVDCNQTQTTDIQNNTTRVRRQNNYFILPDDVIGVEEVLRSSSGMGMGGILPPGMIFPGLIGSITGNACDQTGFGLTTFYAYMEFRALIDFIFFPPKMYNFNQRTHRLWIDGDLSDLRGMMCLQVIAKPNPDIFPDLWNDGWLKLYAVALVKYQWGTNLIKYNQVQLPGGITLNGQQIYEEARNEIQNIQQRFSMDEADPPLDAVG